MVSIDSPYVITKDIVLKIIAYIKNNTLARRLLGDMASAASSNFISKHTDLPSNYISKKITSNSITINNHVYTKVALVSVLVGLYTIVHVGADKEELSSMADSLKTLSIQTLFAKLTEIVKRSILRQDSPSVKKLKEEVDGLKKSQKELEYSLKDKIAEVWDQNEKIIYLKQDLRMLTEASTIKRKEASAKRNSQLQPKEQTIERLKNDIDQSQKKYDNLVKHIEALSASSKEKIEELNTKIRILAETNERTLESSQLECKQLQAKIEEQRAALTEKDAELDQMNEELEKKSKLLKKSSEAVETATTAIRESKKEYDRIIAEEVKKNEDLVRILCEELAKNIKLNETLQREIKEKKRIQIELNGILEHNRKLMNKTIYNFE